MKFVSALFLSFFSVAKAQCLYDVTQDFAYNTQKKYPETIALERKPSSKSLFGYPINSQIGIPACAIMTSAGIEWAARSGFDILTYKTVRSSPFAGHPLPNIVFLEGLVAAPFESGPMTIANSMGIPSLPLDVVLQDIVKAKNSLLPGQVLIVSIIGNPSEEKTVEEDFAFLAQEVAKAGAHIIEANLSCPNLHSPLATYKDPAAVSKIAKAICEAVVDIPVILKVGIFDSFEQMKAVFKAAVQSHAKGICGINSVPMEILDVNGCPAFGESRRIAGVSGDYIRPLALDFVISGRRIIEEENLDLVLLGTGGITKPEHFDLFLEKGADIALSATGSMWNPDLAIEFHSSKAALH
jgi:dihydroorotate dehydrogenase